MLGVGDKLRTVDAALKGDDEVVRAYVVNSSEIIRVVVLGDGGERDLSGADS